MALDTKAWMKSVGFSDEWIEANLSTVEKASGEIEKSVLMRSDYSREMNALKKAETDLTARNEQLTADMAEWAEMSSAEKAANGDLKTKIDDATAKIFTLTQKVTRLATDAGIDPKEILGDDAVVAPAKKVETALYDDTPLRTQIGGIAEYMITLAGDLPYIAAEHKRLTGEDFDARAFTAAIKADIASGKVKAGDLDPIQRWESKFDIAAKRTAAGEKAIEERIATARAEERQIVLTEAALPGQQRPRADTQAPAFRTKTAHDGSVLKRPAPGQRNAGAVAALQNGTYRNGGRKTA